MTEHQDPIRLLRQYLSTTQCTLSQRENGAILTFGLRRNEAAEDAPHHARYMNMFNAIAQAHPEYFPEGIAPEPIAKGKQERYLLEVSPAFMTAVNAYRATPPETRAASYEPPPQRRSKGDWFTPNSHFKRFRVNARERGKEAARREALEDGVLQSMMERSVWTAAENGGAMVFFSDFDAAVDAFRAIFTRPNSHLSVRHDIVCDKASNGTTSLFYFHLPPAVANRTEGMYQERRMDKPENDTPMNDELYKQAASKLAEMGETLAPTVPQSERRAHIMPNKTSEPVSR